MAGTPGRLVAAIYKPSTNGKYYSKYPDGNAFISLSAQAEDTSYATASIHTAILAAAHAADESSAAGTLAGSDIWFGATLPALPQTTPNPGFTLPSAGSTNHGSYYTPSTLAALQTAVNAAAAASGAGGDVIVLTAGTTYGPGILTLPAHGTGNGMIYIVSSEIPELGGTLPAAGARVSSSNASAMPTLLLGMGEDYVITDPQSNSPANNYHLVGLAVSGQGQITSAAHCDSIVGLIAMGFGATEQAGLPSNITVERCYITGDSTYGAHRGITIAGYNISFAECYAENIFDSNVNYNADNQVWACENGGGSFLIRNNDMSAAGESFIFGGADPLISGIAPEYDITIINNTIRKNPANLGVAGVGYGKNACEIKRGVRVLIEGNHIEACWGSQSAAMAITVRNQSNTNPQSQITDVTVINNRIWNVIQPGMGFFSVSGQDTPSSNGNPGTYSEASHRILIRNNICLGSMTSEGGGSQMFLVTQPEDSSQQPSDLIVDHNTFVMLTNDVQNAWLYLGTLAPDTGLSWQNFVWSNNLQAVVSTYGVSDATASAVGMTGALTTVVNGCCINNVVLPSTSASDGLPSGNFQPATLAGIGFNATGLDAEYPGTVGYVLTSGSPYKGAGLSGLGLAANDDGVTDGTDIGCNVSAVAP